MNPSRLLRLALAATAGFALLPVAHAGIFDKAIDAAMGKKTPTTIAPYDLAADPATQASTFVDVARGNKFKDIKKLGIVNFSVEFALFKEAMAVGGSEYAGSARQDYVATSIPAPDVAQLQAIVDRLYAGVQDDFRAQGIEVVPFETLKATKNYANLKPAQHDSPWVTDTKDTQSVFVAPTGMPLYLDNPERADFLKGLGFTFGTNTRMKEVMMVYDLGQEVHLVSVNMVVDFATVSSSGNSFSSYAAKTEATDVHHLHAGDTSYRFVSNTQPEFIFVKLKQPLVSDKVLTADVTKKTTNTDYGVNVATTGTKEKAATGGFDLDTYYARSEEMLNAARKLFAAALAGQK